MIHTNFDSETFLKDQLINIILIVTAIITSLVVCAAEFRAANAGIGWSYRDVIQLGIVGAIVILAFVRNRINIQFKAMLLIILLSAGGVSGAYTLGMLGGTIWIFPTAAVIVSVFYSKLINRMYTIGYWNQIESYISKHSYAEFSHGICPDCAKKLYEELISGSDYEKGIKHSGSE